MAKQLNNGHIFKDNRQLPWFVSDSYIKGYQSKHQAARIFLLMVCSFNNIRLGKMELEFLVAMMLREGVVAQLGKKLFREQHNISQSRVDNIIYLLKKKKILVKIDGKVRIHPKITIPFKEHDNFIFTFKCLKQEKK